MESAREILDKWLVENDFKTYKELANYLGVAPNTVDVWKQRGKIPEKNILKYAQMKLNVHSKITIPNQINSHISNIELEILEAYRELPKVDQEIFYFKIKGAAAEARKKSEELNCVSVEDVKSAG
ncbi:MAG: helix-turn-helix domain-containing protein [Arcobacteraceae bacterium]|nr:helix-turn-helix domain-containing protein [Arcobacteraceae bacterium]